MVKITEVTGGSRADRHGVRAGDFLCTVNGREITDVLDYRFFLADTEVRLGLMRDGSPLEIVIHKREYDDIGLDFETPLMDRKHSCENKCIFCFIDQLPAGMRETLYFKDDDSRLSFLHGNFVTLTNLHDADIQRIMEMHISPINVSVHTTNPELRVKMMHNKRPGWQRQASRSAGRLCCAAASTTAPSWIAPCATCSRWAMHWKACPSFPPG